MAPRRPGATLASMQTPAEIRDWGQPNGDPEHYADFDEVYSDNVVRLYRLMYSKLGNRPDADDLTAEVFVAVLNRIRITAHRAEVRAYLAATARTVLAGYWRRRLGAEVTTVDVSDADRILTEAPPPPPSDAPARAGRLLEPLPRHYRRILELRFLEALSVKEAARAMNITVGYAKVLQHRALIRAAESATSAAADT